MSEQVEKVEQSLEAQAALMYAVNELFAGEVGDVTLESGKQVEFYPAKFKHLSVITELFQAFVGGLGKDEFAKLLNTVSSQQEDKIKAGESPFSLRTDELVKDIAGTASLAMRMLESAVDLLPKYVKHFTNLTEDEFEDLDVDEAMIVAFGIFSRNYNFFIQRLPRVIAAYIAGLKVQQIKAAKTGKVAQKAQ